MEQQDPRIIRNRARALDAAASVLRSEGRDALTQARIATESGVSRATVYRLWPDRHQLMMDALGRLVDMAHTTPTGTDPVADLTAEIISLSRQIDGPLRHVLATLLERAQHDAATAGMFDRLSHDGSAVVRQILRAAHRQGRLRPGLTVDLALSVLVGTVLERHLFRRQPVSRALATGLARLVLIEER